MPAIALALSPDSIAPSVAGAAVALLVALLDALLFDTDVVVVVRLDVVREDDDLPETELECCPDDAVDVSELLALLKDVGIVSVSDGGLLDVKGNGNGVTDGAAELVREVTGTSLLSILDRISDVVGTAGAFVVIGRELSELENSVVIALTVAVIVPAMFGMAPSMLSQTVYPLCVWMSAPIQLEMRHCREPSPMVKPEYVGLVHRNVISAVEVHVSTL